MICSAVELSHQLLAKAVREGGSAIDATAGNGYDTLFLARLVGETGRVFSFDIQGTAIKKTEDLLQKDGMLHRVTLIAKGHEEMDRYVGQNVQGVIFNLGYLPGGDQKIVTAPDTTICALNKSIRLLSPGGVLVMVVYWGHEGGMEEREAVETWVAERNSPAWDVIKITFPHKNIAPYVIGLQKK